MKYKTFLFLLLFSPYGFGMNQDETDFELLDIEAYDPNADTDELLPEGPVTIRCDRIPFTPETIRQDKCKKALRVGKIALETAPYAAFFGTISYAGGAYFLDYELNDSLGTLILTVAALAVVKTCFDLARVFRWARNELAATE